MNIKYDPATKSLQIEEALDFTPKPPPSEFDQALDRLRELYNQLDDEWGETVSDKAQLINTITSLEKQVHNLRAERKDLRFWCRLWGICLLVLLVGNIAMLLTRIHDLNPQDIPAKPVQEEPIYKWKTPNTTTLSEHRRSI